MRAILVCLLLSACGAVQQPEPLTDAVRSYNDGVRWERFQIAAVHVPPRDRSKFVDDADERAHDVKIIDYDVVKVEPRGEKEARVTVKLSWYKESEGTLHETHAVQTWEKHGKGWLVVDESRTRGPEMPGLPEPMAVGETPTKPDGDATGKPGAETAMKPGAAAKPGAETAAKPGAETAAKPGAETAAKPGAETATKPTKD